MAVFRATIGSLFAGIGGLERGLEAAGLGPVLFQVEINPYCRAVLARHYPETKRHDDIRRVSKANLPRVRVLCGGFPCQDVSGAGRGAGIAEGTRSGLWYEYRRIIDEIRPEFVVVENVASGKGRWLCEVRSDLQALGYASRAYAISAADVGAPHRRRRIFVVADRDSDRRWPESPRGDRARQSAGIAHRRRADVPDADDGRAGDERGERGEGEGERTDSASRRGRDVLSDTDGDALRLGPERLPARRAGELRGEGGAVAADGRARLGGGCAPPTDIGSPRSSGTSTGGVTTSPKVVLNPRFVEALMGFPPGWAMLPSPQLSLPTTPPPASSSPPSATPSSPSAPSPSDGSSGG